MHVTLPSILRLFTLSFSLLLFFTPPVCAEVVSLQLKWTHQFQFAGYYAAVEKGFYQAEGLQVILKEGSPSVNIAQAVTSGEASFGVNNTALLADRDQGAPIRVIAAIFQHSPQAVMVRKDSGITSPHDLKNKKLMLTEAQSTDILAMLINEGLDPQQITLLPHTWDVNDLINGNADAMTAYTTADPFLMQKKGVPVTLIHPLTYGIDYYGDCLFTSETLIKAQPELVRRFTRASLRGWEYAMSHQAEIIDLIITKYNPALSREKLESEAAELNKIILPEYVDIGHMNPGRWAKIVEIHQKFGLLKDDFSVDSFLYNVNDTNSAYSFYRSLVLPLLTVIGILAFCLFAFIFFNTRLKRIVRLRTEELEEKVSELQEKEKLIRHLAYHDALTKLPNRLKLIELIDSQAAIHDAFDGQFAVAFLDLDDFKHINDAMGHSAGDEFLKLVAVRLQQCLEERGIVCRLGGDEFTLLLPRIDGSEHIASFMPSVVATVSQPWDFQGSRYQISASIGIALYPQDGRNADALLKAADMAMYEAKNYGKNCYRFFTREMHTTLLEKLTLEADLYQAIAASQFILYYQPQLDEQSRIIAVEALIRWNHPTRGLLLPGSFIPIAEKTGLILPIGEWVMRTACIQCAHWQKDSRLPRFRISVNVSAKELYHPSFLTNVRNILKETGLKPQYLELEITETIAVTYAELVIPLMNELRSLGVRLALDDFGTGYSSLMYLKNFPIDVLKIDKALIQDVPVNQDDEAILQSILVLAKNLKISAVAEGVETSSQLDYLRKYLCPVVQGYLFSPPIPWQDLQLFLLKYSAGNQTLPPAE